MSGQQLVFSSVVCYPRSPIAMPARREWFFHGVFGSPPEKYIAAPHRTILSARINLSTRHYVGRNGSGATGRYLTQ